MTRKSAVETVKRMTHGERRVRRREMAREVSNGLPYSAVAYKFGVSESHVRVAVAEFAAEFTRPRKGK
ncbi:MAG: hypothetical protein QM811_16525 [Pirellulales bacterium]